jgi:hypothetical protein
VAATEWDVHVVWFELGMGGWLWCVKVYSGLCAVVWGCRFRVVMMGYDVASVCRGRHVVGDAVSVGSQVGDGAWSVPVVWVHVVLLCSRSFQTSDTVPIVVSILALCCIRGSDPCLRALCLQS